MAYRDPAKRREAQRRTHDHDHDGAACQACGRPLDSDLLHLCGHCAATIDRDTEALLERELFDPGWEG